MNNTVMMLNGTEWKSPAELFLGFEGQFLLDFA